MITTEDGIVVGNVYDKYHSKNPIARYLMNGFERALFQLIEQTGAGDIHEIGCGEGHLAAKMAESGKRHVRGSDFSGKMIEQARLQYGQQVEFKAADIYSLVPEQDSSELIVCCEVLEHLDDPPRALRILASLARPYCILSVPREPLWRALNMARGKYVFHLGNTPGHQQHWSSKAFVHLVSRHFEIMAVSRPVPWTMVLAKTG